MAITMLCYYWSTMTPLYSMSNELNPSSTVSDTSLEHSHVVDQQDAHFRSTEQTKTVTILASFCKHRIVTFVSFAVTVSHMVLTMIATQYGQLKGWVSNHPEDATAISGFLSIAIFLPAIYLMVQCHFRLRNTLPHYASLGSNDYLLVFTATWCFLYDILQFMASSDLIRSGKTSLGVMGILLSTCFLAENSFQTRFLLTIQRVNVADESSRDYIRSCLIYIMIVNAGNWVLTGLAHEWADGIFAPLISMSLDGDLKVGSFIIFVIFPMMSLYRFHSTVICCEMLKTLYQPHPDEPERPEQSLETFWNEFELDPSCWLNIIHECFRS